MLLFSFYLFHFFCFSSVVVCQSLIDVLIKRDTMKQHLQGNILQDFPLIRFYASDVSLLFNCILCSGGKKKKILTQIFCPSLKTISCILLCQNPLRQLYPFYFCFALVYL